MGLYGLKKQQMPLNQFSRKTSTSLYGGFRCLLMVMGLFWGIRGEAQQAMERVYADSQTNNDCSGTLLCTTTVTDEGNAVDGYLNTYSTLSITALGSVWQELEFTGSDQPSASDAVHIKIGTQSALLGLLTGVSVQAYNNGSAVGSPVQLSALISLLNGADQQEIVFTSGVPFDAVRLTNTAVSLGGGLDIYEAYFYKPIPGQIACDEAVDVLYGSTGSIAGGLNSVENAYNAIDNDGITFATIRANVSALNKTHLTALFPTASSSGDLVKIVLENPDGGLLDANVLATNFTIRTYLDNTDNGALALDPALLRLSLFPGSTNKQVLLYPINQPFNRIQISLGEGLATALDNLLVYEINRIEPPPEIIGVPASGDITICYNTTAILTATNSENTHELVWYSKKYGGIPLDTIPYGQIYTTNPLVSDTTFYVASRIINCLKESPRDSVYVKVLPDIGHPTLTITNTND